MVPVLFLFFYFLWLGFCGWRWDCGGHNTQSQHRQKSAWLWYLKRRFKSVMRNFLATSLILFSQSLLPTRWVTVSELFPSFCDEQKSHISSSTVLGIISLCWSRLLQFWLSSSLFNDFSWLWFWPIYSLGCPSTMSMLFWFDVDCKNRTYFCAHNLRRWADHSPFIWGGTENHQRWTYRVTWCCSLIWQCNLPSNS